MASKFSPDNPKTITRGLLKGRTYERESAYRRDLQREQFQRLSSREDFFSGREDHMRQSAENNGLSDTQFEKHYAATVKEGWSTRPHGAYAKLLEWLGWREEGSEDNVGDTPGGE